MSQPHPGEHARAPRPKPTSRGPKLGQLRGHIPLLAIVALAVFLRVWNLRHGLPDFLEEAVPFRKALAMWQADGSVDWNPHLFHYPSLTIYLQLLVQKLHYLAARMFGGYTNVADYLVSFQTDPTPMAILGRLVGVASDAAAVVVVARVGERLRRGAGILAALLVACAPTLILTSRSIFSDTVMAVLMVAALERMLAYREAPGRGRLAAAVVLTGLATGAKYPAAVLLIPLGLVLWERHRWRGLGTWAVCAAAAFAVFLATTPYALLDFRTFSRDFAFVGRIGAEGHLGNIEGTGFLFYLRHLPRDLAIGAVLLPVSLALTVAGVRRRTDAVAVWLTLLAFAVPISLAHVLAERYLVPVLLLAAPLVAAAAFELLERVPGPARTGALAAGLAVLGLPPLVAGIRAGASGSTSTHIEARRWCEEHLRREDLLMQELYGAAILSRQETFIVQSRLGFDLASPEVQKRYRARRWFSSVSLPLVVVGKCVSLVKPPNGPAVEVQIFPHVADLNQLVYDPRLFAGADYVLTSSAVRGRFAADPARYPLQNRLYALLDSTAEVAARFRPKGEDAGPEIVIYRMTARGHAAIARLGPLDELWWAKLIPQSYRDRAEELLLRPEERTGGALRDAKGEPAAWVISLRGVYKERFAQFVRAMGMELLEQGEPELARRYAAATLAVDPGDVGACLMYVTGSRRLGAWKDARAALERSMATAARSGEASEFLRLEYADVLAHDGEADRARHELETLTKSEDDYVMSEAKRRLAALPP